MFSTRRDRIVRVDTGFYGDEDSQPLPAVTNRPTNFRESPQGPRGNSRYDCEKHVVPGVRPVGTCSRDSVISSRQDTHRVADVMLP